MPEGVFARMAIEWGFLILLAVGAAIADLRPALMILVTAVGWVLIVLVELLAWRARPAYVVEEPSPAAMYEPTPAFEPGEEPPLQPSIPPSYDFEFKRPAAAPSVAEDTAVTPTLPPPAEEEDEEERERLQQADQRVIHRLEPLQPRRRRGWFRR